MGFALAGDGASASSAVSTSKTKTCFRNTLTPFVFQMEYGPTDIGCNRLVWLGLWVRDWHAAPRGRARGLSLRAKNQCTNRRRFRCAVRGLLPPSRRHTVPPFSSPCGARAIGHSHRTARASVGVVEPLYNQVLPRNLAERNIESALKHYEFLDPAVLRAQETKW